MGLGKKYRKSLAKQWAMRFKTRLPDDDYYDGIVTHIKSKFIVLQEEIGFEFDGVEILPKKFIRGFRDGKYEKCSNKLIRESGEITKLQPLQWLDKCESIRAVIGQLYEQGIWPGIEWLCNNGKKSSFYLGPITAVKKKCFALHHYDGAGYWVKNYRFEYQDIGRIVIEDRYSRNFNAYMLKGWDPEGKGDVTESETESIV